MSLGEINDPIAGWVRWDGSRRETVIRWSRGGEATNSVWISFVKVTPMDLPRL